MFKNILVYRFNPGLVGDPAVIEAALQSACFVPCGASQERSLGWVEPRGDKNGPLVESVAGQLILKIMFESKVLPSSVVKDEAAKRIVVIEQQTGRKPGKKETKEIREDIRLQLLAQAFTKKSSALVWLDPKAHLLIIEAGSQSRADDIVTLLVKCLDGLVVSLAQTKQSPPVCMSRWLNTMELPSGFTADRDCVLKSPDESKATVRYAHHALDTSEVQAHIAAGKVPTQLAMTWDSKVSFVLADNGAIKRVEFLDAVFDGRTAAGRESGFDADVAISTGTLSQMIPDLVEALGGYADAVAG